MKLVQKMAISNVWWSHNGMVIGQDDWCDAWLFTWDLADAMGTAVQDINFRLHGLETSSLAMSKEFFEYSPWHRERL